MMNKEKILSYLSLASASRSTVCGSDLVLKEIRKGKGSLCVILSSEASERTTKQIKDKCAFYNVFLITIDCTLEELGRRIGKISPTAVVAVTNRGLCEQIKKYSAEN